MISGNHLNYSGSTPELNDDGKTCDGKSFAIKIRVVDWFPDKVHFVMFNKRAGVFYRV